MYVSCGTADELTYPAHLAFCKHLKEKGVEPAVMGVEVISDAILATGVEAAAKANYDATRAVLAQAWPEVLEK